MKNLKRNMAVVAGFVAMSVFGSDVGFWKCVEHGSGVANGCLSAA